MIGVGMLVPILPVLFTDPTSPSFLLQGYSVGEQYFMAGLLTALFGLMQFIASPILGELSDAYGRKKLLTLGVAVLAVSQLIFGFGIEIASLWLLLVSRMVAGLAGANFSIAQAAIADVSAPNERAKNFGLIGAAFGIGFILGPLLGGFIAETTHNAAAPFWFAGILGIVNVLFISLMLPETHKTMSGAHHFHWLKGIHNIRDAFRDRDARPVYLTNFLYMSGFSFFVSFIGVLLVAKFHFSEASIGTFFGVVGAWMVVTQLFLLRLVAGKYSERAYSATPYCSWAQRSRCTHSCPMRSALRASADPCSAAGAFLRQPGRAREQKRLAGKAGSRARHQRFPYGALAGSHSGLRRRGHRACRPQSVIHLRRAPYRGVVARALLGQAPPSRRIAFRQKRVIKSLFLRHIVY